MADTVFSEVQRLVNAVGSPLERQLLLSCTLPSRRPLVGQAYSWAIADDEELFTRVHADQAAKQRFVGKLMPRLAELLVAYVQSVGVGG